MKKALPLFALMLAAMLLVACGGGSSTTSSTTPESSAEHGGTAAGGASTIKLETGANGHLEYTTKHLNASPGKATVEFHNGQSLGHDVAIANSSGQVIGKTSIVTESTTTTTVDLKPGTYTFYCTVPGHRQAGMEGTLTVK